MMTMYKTSSNLFLACHRANMPLLRSISIRTLLVASGTALTVYWIALFVMTHLPPELVSRILFNFFSSGDEVLEEGGDKTMHLVAYAGLAFLLASFLWIRGVEGIKRWKVTFIVLGVYAIVDELLQIPFRRTADVRDCIADWVGVAIGYCCFLLARLLIDRLRHLQTPSPAETPSLAE